MSAASKIPSLRFNGFDGKWTDTSLGGLGGSWFKGQPFSKNDLSDEGLNKCIHYGELFTIYGAVIENVSSTTNALRRIGSIEGDLLFPASDVTPDGLGRCSALFVDGVLLGGDLIGFRQDEVDSKFLSYAINNCRDQIIRVVTGTTVRHSSAEKLKSVVASIPVNKDEQQKIGATFRSLDALIADRESAVEKLQTLKKAMLEKMFPRAGAKVPEVRFKGFEGKWKAKRLGEINGAWFKAQPFSKSELDPSGKQECVHYGELFTQYGAVAKRVLSRTHSSSRTGSKTGDILFPASDVTPDGLGRCTALMRDDVLLGGDMFFFRQSEVDSEFLSYSICSSRKQIFALVSGTTVRHVSPEKWKEVVVLIPQSKDEQREVSKYLESFDALISARQEEVGKLKNLKKALLDRMFV